MAEIQLDQGDAGQSQPAAVGDEVVIVLPETPTSGYRWVVDAFEAGVVEIVDDAFEPPDPGRVGGSGTRRFRFRVVGAGSSPIRLILARPWDPTSTVDTYQARIEATAATDGGADASGTDRGADVPRDSTDGPGG